MKIEQLRNLELAKYWSLPKGENYQTKFKKELEKQNYILTLKRDGALYRYSKSDSNTLLQSRTISKKTGELVEKQDNVPTIISELDANLPPNTMLLGEIAFPIGSGKTSAEVVSIMGCLPDKAIARQKDTPVHYYIFDVLMYDGIEYHNSSYEQRMVKLGKIQNGTKWTDAIEFAQPIFTNIEEGVAEFLALGEEGGMLMHKEKPYTFGKRPAWHSIKIKQELGEDIDLVIVGFSPPVEDYTGKYPVGWKYWKSHKTGEVVEGSLYSNGGYKPVSENYFYNKVGGFILGAYNGNQLIEVCKVANLTDKIRDEATEMPDIFMGKVVKVQAMSVDKERRSLRHPKLMGFHADKNPTECQYKEIFG